MQLLWDIIMYRRTFTFYSKMPMDCNFARVAVFHFTWKKMTKQPHKLHGFLGKIVHDYNLHFLLNPKMHVTYKFGRLPNSNAWPCSLRSVNTEMQNHILVNHKRNIKPKTMQICPRKHYCTLTRSKTPYFKLSLYK